MALFKIEKGLAANLAANRPKANEGYAYFTTDDGKFYIDISGNGTQDAVIGTNRICLNAAHADTAGRATGLLTTAGSPTQPIYINSTTGLPTAINYTIQTSVPANALFTDERVKQTVKSDDKEYNLLFSSIDSLTSGTTEEAGYDDNITVNPSTSTITASYFEGALKFKNLVPTFTKVYESTSYYASSASAAAGTWYFLNIIPDDWYKPWEVLFKIHSYCPNYPIVHSISYCLVTGSGATISYSNWNQRADSYAHYYTTVYPLKKAGFDAGYGHAIGIQVYNSTSSTTAAYYRTFEIDYYDCKNCTATFLDEPVKWSNWTGTGTTNYSSIVNMNAVDRGLQETGDANSTTISTLYKQYGGLVAGDAIKRYQFVFQQLPPNQNKLIPIFGTDNITTATKTLLTTEFDPLGFIFFYNNSNSYTSGANIDPGRLYYNVLADLRYSFNISSTTSATAFTGANYQPLYLRVNINSITGGASVDGNQPLTSDLPTSNDGKYYIYLGQMYDYYRVMLDSLTNHPVFYHNGTEIVRYYGKEIGGNASSANQVNHNLTLKINTGTTEGTDLYTFNGLTNKSLDIKAGNNVTFNTSTAGELIINSSFTNTDTKVTQTAVTHTSYSNWRPLIWGASNSATEDFNPSTVTDQVYTAKNLSVQPSTGTIKATTFKGNATSATEFSSNATVTLTGDITGVSAGSKKSWSVATTITDGVVTNAKLENSSISIAGNTIALGDSLSAATLRSSLGLTNAMHFIGTTTTTMSDGLTTANVVIDGSAYTPSKGDVVLYDNKEFVWIGTSWELLGQDGSFKIIQTAVSSPAASGNATAFIDTISQNANGEITVTKKNVQSGSTSQSGIVQLTDSYTSTNSTLAITGKGVAAAIATLQAGTGLTLDGSTFNHINSITARDSYVDNATTASANGGVIKVNDIQYDTTGHITAARDRSITLSLPVATSTDLGGIQIGYTASGKNYPVVLNNSNQAYVNVPWTDTNKYHKTGSWNGLTYTATAVNSAEALAFTIPTGTTSTTVALGNHTHSLDLAEDTGTNALTLGYGKKYKLTAGGETFIFTMPGSDNTTYSAGTGLSLSGTTFNHSNSVTAKTAYASTATTASANGGTIKVTDIQYDAQGHITASTDRTITLSQVTYTLSDLGGIGTVSASGTAPLTLSASKTGTSVAITGSISAASTSATGIVQLNDSVTSTATDQAATANAVKTAYDLASNKTTGNARIFYGTCDTAAATTTKAVTCVAYDALTVGDIVVVKFTNTNSGAVASLKLDVNGTGAKNIKRIYNAAISNLYSAGELRGGSVGEFIYDGTYWILTNADYNSTYYYTSIYCTTGAATAAKTGSVSGAQELTAGKYFQVWIQNSNTAKSALTLNISSQGAKPIYINGEPSSATNYTLPRGCYIVYYDGTNYHFRTDDKLPGNIAGNAATASSIAWGGVTGKPTATGSNTTGISISNHSTTTITGVSGSTTASKASGNNGTASTWEFEEITIPNVTSKGTASSWTFSEVTIPNVTSAGTASTWAFDDITVPIRADSGTTVATSAGSATSCDDITAWSAGSGSYTQGSFNGGSGSFTATVTNHVLSFSHTHTAATHGTDSHTHTAPSLSYTSRSITGVGGTTTIWGVKSGTGSTTTASKASGSNGTAPTLGTAIKVQSKSGGSNGTAPTLGTAIKVQSMSGGDNSTAPTWAFTDVTVPKAATSSTTVVTSGTHTITDPGHTHSI